MSDEKDAPEKDIFEQNPFDPMSASSAMGVHHMPVGTMEEIEAQGLDPDAVATCHKRDKEHGVRGCPVWSSCKFHLRDRNGGVWKKGEGPRNIGYYLKTSRADQSHAVENFMPCYVFVLSLEHRMRAGRAARDEGKDHEVIQIIGQEGDKIYVKRYENLAADGGNRSGDIRQRSVPVEITIPKFLRPSQNPGVTYDQILRERQEAREEAADDASEDRQERVARLMSEGVQDATVRPPRPAKAVANGGLAEPQGRRQARADKPGAAERAAARAERKARLEAAREGLPAEGEAT